MAVDKGAAMNEYQPPTTEDAIAALGDWSENTASMLVSVVLEYTTADQDRHDVIAGIKAVIDGKPQGFGDEFEARVWEALTFTPDPFNRPCNYDLP